MFVCHVDATPLEALQLFVLENVAILSDAQLIALQQGIIGVHVSPLRPTGACRENTVVSGNTPRRYVGHIVLSPGLLSHVEVGPWVVLYTHAIYLVS